MLKPISQHDFTCALKQRAWVLVRCQLFLAAESIHSTCSSLVPEERFSELTPLFSPCKRCPFCQGPKIYSAEPSPEPCSIQQDSNLGVGQLDRSVNSREIKIHPPPPTPPPPLVALSDLDLTNEEPRSPLNLPRGLARQAFHSAFFAATSSRKCPLYKLQSNGFRFLRADRWRLGQSDVPLGNH